MNLILQKIHTFHPPRNAKKPLNRTAVPLLSSFSASSCGMTRLDRQIDCHLIQRLQIRFSCPLNEHYYLYALCRDVSARFFLFLPAVIKRRHLSFLYRKEGYRLLSQCLWMINPYPSGMPCRLCSLHRHLPWIRFPQENACSLRQCRHLQHPC